MIWRLSSLPELQHLTQAQRVALIRSSIGPRFELRMWITSVIKGFALSVLLIIVVSIALTATGAQPANSVAMLLPLMLWPVFAVGLFQFSMIRIRGQIRLYLCDQRTLAVKPPVCLKCGYAVEDSAERCPECGEPV